MPLAGNPHRQRFADEAAKYRDLGITSAVVFHGSDARDPQLSIDLNKHSFFVDADPDWSRQLGARARRNRESVQEAGLPVFVTTPDMLQHVENSSLLPITLSPGGWENGRPPMERRIPTVLHRPSASATQTKGTPYIERVLEDLERRRRIEVIRSTVVSHRNMPALLARADIVIDQIQTGAYGVIAIEAMAAGRVVIGSVSDHTRTVMGDDLPIIDANPESLDAVLDAILDDRDGAQSAALAGPSFVERWHDGAAASRVLEGWLLGHDTAAAAAD